MGLARSLCGACVIIVWCVSGCARGSASSLGWLRVVGHCSGACWAGLGRALVVVRCGQDGVGVLLDCVAALECLAFGWEWRDSAAVGSRVWLAARRPAWRGRGLGEGQCQGMATVGRDPLGCSGLSCVAQCCWCSLYPVPGVRACVVLHVLLCCLRVSELVTWSCGRLHACGDVSHSCVTSADAATCVAYDQT